MNKVIFLPTSGVNIWSLFFLLFLLLVFFLRFDLQVITRCRIRDAPRRLMRSERSSFGSIGPRPSPGEATAAGLTASWPSHSGRSISPETSRPSVRVRPASNQVAPTDTAAAARPPRRGGRQSGRIMGCVSSDGPIRLPCVTSRPVTPAPRRAHQNARFRPAPAAPDSGWLVELAQRTDLMNLRRSQRGWELSVAELDRQDKGVGYSAVRRSRSTSSRAKENC